MLCITTQAHRKHTVTKKSKTKLTHISRRKSLEVMTNLGKPTASRESCNSWPATMLVYSLCRQPSCSMTCLFHEKSPVGLYDMIMLFRRPSCSMTCLLYEENSIGFYSIFTLCRQLCWSPWLVYFLKRILLVSVTCIMQASILVSMTCLLSEIEFCWFSKHFCFMLTTILVSILFLLSEENPVDFYDMFTFCRQLSWSPWHVYFLRRVLLASTKCLLSD